MRPSTETVTAYYLIKRTTTQHLTNQIRELAQMAWEDRKMLVIDVPFSCRLSAPLKAFVAEWRDLVRIERA